MKKNLFLLFSLIFFFYPVTVICSENYIIGEGDVLSIYVYENEDLSQTVRINADNSIRVPLLGEVNIKGLTVPKIASKLESLFADGYLINPQVDVFVKEFKSKTAVILGQIRSPGQYELRGKITFLEFVSKAGGLTEDAGSNATIKRANTKTKQTNKLTIDLDKLIREGETSLNLPIQNGDTIYISKADVYYVSGEVEDPDSYRFTTDLTVIMAITKAGGFTEIASKRHVKIIREIEGEKKVLKNVNMDEIILANDVIIVPESFF
ncbi:MAG: periplasmic polysaccharide biosynthesis/export protein [Desulfobacteraceae bacterium]|nr:periplasmic polysaccharide biosynthesis/export protein [Desulfobacteraceae bacterium]